MRNHRALRAFGGVLAAALIALAFLPSDVALAQVGQPGGVTEEAQSMHRLYLVVVGMAFAVFFGVVGALLFALVRYRRRRPDEPLPSQIHGSAKIEILWVSIPIVIVLTLFTYSAVVLAKVDRKADPDALTVHVQGFQFQWRFTYDLRDLGTRSPVDQDGTISILGTPSNEPELVIPVGEPVEFVLESSDVIHSFYVRDFLYKLDVIPGLENRFVVKPVKTGVYRGQCAEFCGVDHALMRFTVRIVTRDEFDAWIREQVAAQAREQGGGSPLAVTDSR